MVKNCMLKAAFGILACWIVFAESACALSPLHLRPETLPATAVDDELYIQLRRLGRFYGARESQLKVDPLLLGNDWARLEFASERRRAFVGPVMVWLHMPIRETRGRWGMARIDLLRTLDPILRPREYLATNTCSLVVIDPGHGGKDSGALGPAGLQEKDVALDIARKVRHRLAQDGIAVKLTRDNDRFIELGDRARLAREWKGDVFVSIHLNAAGNTGAQGVETYVLPSAGYPSTADEKLVRDSRPAELGNAHDDANIILGYFMHRGLLQQTGAEDRGLRRARFKVLRESGCPAVLLECGFLSNEREEALFEGEEYRDRVADGIARGLRDYARAIERAKLNGARLPPLASPGAEPPPRRPVADEGEARREAVP